MAKKRGNPNWEKTSFKTERKESCNVSLGLKIPASLNANLKAIDGWQDKVRKTLEQLVELESA